MPWASNFKFLNIFNPTLNNNKMPPKTFRNRTPVAFHKNSFSTLVPISFQNPPRLDTKIKFTKTSSRNSTRKLFQIKMTLFTTNGP